ncbi:hypothetical protein VPHK369_0104 [Vibrio phage K369]
MDIKTKNAEIVYAVEKELGKHIGAVTNHFTTSRNVSGVLTVLDKTITPLNDLANPYTLTVTFINDQVDRIILSHGERCVSIPRSHIKCFVETFARRIQEIRDDQ